MAFKLSLATSYPWPISGESAGYRFSFKGEFAFLPQPRIDELTLLTARRRRLLEQGEDDPELQEITTINIAREILVGWSGVTDDDNEPVEFTEDLKEEILLRQGVAAAVVEAWNESLTGGKRGNSKAPRGIG